MSCIEPKPRILIVDDAPASRKLAERMIVSLGYAATVASNGTMAMALFDQGERFDLLFTDLLMPGIDGCQLVRELRSRDPAMLVLFTSGLPLSQKELDELDARYIAKPYRKAEIAVILRDTLKTK